MRVYLLAMLALMSCTVPPDVPVKEDPPIQTGIAEAPPEVPPAPPKQKPPKPPPATAKTDSPPPLPQCPEPSSSNPQRQTLQMMDCLIIIKELKP